MASISEHLLLAVHHGGSFLRNHEGNIQKYVGGLMCFLEAERDKYSFLDLQRECGEITMKSHKIMVFNFKYPGISLNEKIGTIGSDKDLMDMFDLDFGSDGKRVEFDIFITMNNMGPLNRVERAMGPLNRVARAKHVLKDVQVSNIIDTEFGEGEGRVEVEVNASNASMQSEDDTDEEVNVESEGEGGDYNEELLQEEVPQLMKNIRLELSDYDEGSTFESASDGSCDSGLPRNTHGDGIEFDSRTQTEDPKLCVGLEFENAAVCRKVLRQYAIKNLFNMVFLKNEGKRVTAKCKVDGCPWCIHISIMQDGVGFKVRTLNEKHICDSNDGKGEEMASQAWIANEIESRVQMNPKMEVKHLQHELQRMFGFKLSYHKVWRAREIAIAKVRGSYETSFSRVPSFCTSILQYIPGSTAVYRTTPNHEFQRLFVSFNACKMGFVQYCRPYIGLDGTFLKGKYRGVMLTAITIDAQKGILLLANAVVESECNETWWWFLMALKQAFGDLNYTFMSDRQKGLVDAVSRLFPGSQHRYCMRHLHANLKALEFGKGTLLRNMFWSAARAYTQPQFEYHMEQMKQLFPDAFAWIENIPRQHWCRAFFPDEVPSPQIENNVSESFNNFIGDARDMPICELIDSIRRKLMVKFQMRREESENWKGMVVPKVEQQILEAISKSRYADIIYAGNDEYEVDYKGGRHTVYTKDQKCTCREWQVNGVPCIHDVAVFVKLRQDPQSYCSPYFTCDAYRGTYGAIIHSIPDKSMWVHRSEEVVLPPQVKRAPGRPKRLRKRGSDEGSSQGPRRTQGSTILCSRCKGLGHNKKMCKGPISGSQAQNTPPNPVERSATTATSSSQVPNQRIKLCVKRGASRVSQMESGSQEMHR